MKYCYIESITTNNSDVPNFAYLVFSIRTLLQIKFELASTQHFYPRSSSGKLMHDLIIKSTWHYIIYYAPNTMIHFNTDRDKLMHDLITKTDGHWA